MKLGWLVHQHAPTVEPSHKTYWGCDTVWRSPDQEIVKGDFLSGEAYRGQGSAACLWLRGLVPKAWTHREEVDAYVVDDIPESDFQKYDPEIPVFLDGTGGPSRITALEYVIGLGYSQPL